MLLQTNSYIVPKDRRSEHARLLQRFRQTLNRLGCEHFEVYEQVGANWSGNEATGRFVQIMRFNDRKHQQEVQNAEKSDQAAQQLIREFCELINFPYQQQQGLFAVGYYNSVLHSRAGGPRPATATEAAAGAESMEETPSPDVSPSAEVVTDEAGEAYPATETTPEATSNPMVQPEGVNLDDLIDPPDAATHVEGAELESVDIDALLEEPMAPATDDVLDGPPSGRKKKVRKS